MTGAKPRCIFLSPPHMGGEELKFVQAAFASNYIAPMGPMVDAFEQEFAEYVGIKHCAAVCSGTAAMHLALRCLGVGPGDEVFASTLTFIGSVSPITFLGATPVFIDCDRESWNMDPGLLEAELKRCAVKGNLPKAVVPTDLYGQCSNYNRIFEVCDRYKVPVVLDSAEALGARFKVDERIRKSEDQKGTKNLRAQMSDLWRHSGWGAKAAVFSFNGNKIITTSGGGMVASDDEGLIAHAKKLSQQARENFPHYEHVEIGYNYRMSNIVSAIGRGQLQLIEERIRRKREIFDHYRAILGDMPGIEFMPEPGWSRSNRWLTVIIVDPEQFVATRENIRLALEAENIESRPLWKPMHLQPVFEVRQEGEGRRQGGEGKNGVKQKKYAARVVGGEVAEDLFNRGLCLPSGTAMTEDDLDRVIAVVKSCYRP